MPHLPSYSAAEDSSTAKPAILFRHRTAGRPIKQLDGMDDRDGGAGRNFVMSANIAGRNHIRLKPLDVGDLALPHLPHQRRLKDV